LHFVAACKSGSMKRVSYGQAFTHALQPMHRSVSKSMICGCPLKDRGAARGVDLLETDRLAWGHDAATT